MIYVIMTTKDKKLEDIKHTFWILFYVNLLVFIIFSMIGGLEGILAFSSIYFIMFILFCFFVDCCNYYEIKVDSPWIPGLEF